MRLITNLGSLTIQSVENHRPACRRQTVDRKLGEGAHGRRVANYGEGRAQCGEFLKEGDGNESQISGACFGNFIGSGVGSLAGGASRFGCRDGAPRSALNFDVSMQGRGKAKLLGGVATGLNVFGILL